MFAFGETLKQSEAFLRADQGIRVTSQMRKSKIKRLEGVGLIVWFALPFSGEESSYTLPRYVHTLIFAFPLFPILISSFLLLE